MDSIRSAGGTHYRLDSHVMSCHADDIQFCVYAIEHSTALVLQAWQRRLRHAFGANNLTKHRETTFASYTQETYE